MLSNARDGFFPTGKGSGQPALARRSQNAKVQRRRGGTGGGAVVQAQRRRTSYHQTATGAFCHEYMQKERLRKVLAAA